MDESPIKPGDVVILRSGGPELTVSRISYFDGESLVEVHWFVESGELRTQFFASAALTHAKL